MDFVKIATTDDFITHHLRSYSLLGRKVAVVKRKDGSYFAVEGACKHQGADLAAGEIRGMVVTCPRHQWQYDLESGQCLNHDSPPLRRYGLEIRGDGIYVTLTPIDD
jgi:nitrite reductase/ring-hydroxylating ferredoxin subunit